MDERGALIPFLSFALAVITLLVYYAGGEILFFIPLAFTGLLALVGMIFGTRQRPVWSRVSCAMAVLLASTPFLIPVVQAIRIKHLAAKRAIVTRPIYASLEKQIEELKAPIANYYKTYNVMPDLQGETMLPYVDERGQLRNRPAMDTNFEAPTDPFDDTKTLRWVAVRDKGVVLVSVGQDGVPELPLPGVSMDGPPMEPLVPFAMIGYDQRLFTYDPTNGALGLGDVVHWVGKGKYEEAFDPLFKAWDKAESASPYKPTAKSRPSEPDPDPQSRRDAKAARKLLDKGDYLAALALSTRGLRERTTYPKEWDAHENGLQYTQGVALYNLGAYREAADALTMYLDINPNDAMGHYYLAAALFMGGDVPTSRVHMAAASQIDPNSSIADSAASLMQQMAGGQTPQLPEPWIVRQERERAERETQLRNAPQPPPQNP